MCLLWPFLKKIPLPILANASFQINKHVPHCSIVGYGRAAKLRLEWVPGETPPTSHPYRAAKQRLRVAPGGSLGSYEPCTATAANAAIRKHPSQKHCLSSLLQKAQSRISCTLMLVRDQLMVRAESRRGEHHSAALVALRGFHFWPLWIVLSCFQMAAWTRKFDSSPTV